MPDATPARPFAGAFYFSAPAILAADGCTTARQFHGAGLIYDCTGGGHPYAFADREFVAGAVAVAGVRCGVMIACRPPSFSGFGGLLMMQISDYRLQISGFRVTMTLSIFSGVDIYPRFHSWCVMCLMPEQRLDDLIPRPTTEHSRSRLATTLFTETHPAFPFERLGMIDG